jgi:hypothetical protein
VTGNPAEHRDDDLQGRVGQAEGVHQRLGDLEEREGDHAPADQRAEDPPPLQLGQQVAEGRLAPLRMDWRRAVGRLRTELLLDGNERRQHRRTVSGSPLRCPVEHLLDQIGEFGGARHVELAGGRRLR